MVLVVGEQKQGRATLIIAGRVHKKQALCINAVPFRVATGHRQPDAGAHVTGASERRSPRSSFLSSYSRQKIYECALTSCTGSA